MLVSNCCISQGSVATYLRCGGNYYNGLLEIYFSLQQCKKFWNQLRFDKVIAEVRDHSFFGTQYIYIYIYIYIGGYWWWQSFWWFSNACVTLEAFSRLCRGLSVGTAIPTRSASKWPVEFGCTGCLSIVTRISTKMYSVVVTCESHIPPLRKISSKILRVNLSTYKHAKAKTAPPWRRR